MSAVERRGAPEPRLEIRPSRNRHFRRPQRLTSIWLPDGSDPSHRAHRTPIYVSFVSKAILWDRGLRHDTVHDHAAHRPSLCPRFLSHMKAHPENLIPPRYLSSKSVHQLPSQGKMQNPPAVAAPKSHMLAGCFHLNPERRTSGVQNAGLITGRRSAVVVPRLRLPATPPPSTINPTPPQPNTPQSDAERQKSKTSIAPASPSYLPPPPPPPPPPIPPPPPPPEVPVREKLLQPAVVEPDSDLNIKPAGSTLSASPTSLSQGSLSDLSRPPSSLFSRSTDLSSGRSSVLSDKATADILDSDPEDSACLSPLQPSPTMLLPLASPATSSLHQSFSSTKPPLYEPLFGRTEPLSPRQASGFHLKSDKPPSSSSRRSTKTAENLHLDPSVGPDLNPSLDSDRGRATPAFRSTTWSSCPSPQRTTPCSGSAAKMTPSPPASRLESHRWPILPPISPVRGRSAASHCSELSCTQSCVFDELEAIAPLSASCLSLDEPSDSSGSPSPDTDLSPGLAALTVACDSGNLGSLSRVRLLLLDRLATGDQSPSGLEEEIYPLDDWSDLMQYDTAGVLRPRTAGSVSERCDSAGKVRGNKSDQSDGGSESPSSWIIDPSPSFSMFRSSSPPCQSNHSCHTDDGGPSEEESIHPGWKDRAELLDGGRRSESDRTEEKERRMEERKTKALNMLSKLQDDTPRQRKASKDHSNFEDFDFLAKYCIFSQEKLAEYKRAFEAEDSDDDGYISCLQVLLALKTITPPELLSDEEEIYVYRILEMVDFRVTDGLVDLRLFAVIASLAQKIASMDEFMRSLITNMDFRSLEVRLFKAKLNELVVGDTSGKLLVYKNDDSKPCITRTCVGMLTCVAVGDVCNKGKNFVVAVGAEGWFHLFDLTATTASKAESSSQHEFLSSEDQKPFFTQHIPANTKVILISDIDGDGRYELVVGYTDRVVRAFRWEEASDGSDAGSGQLVLLKKWLLEGQVDSLSVNPGPEGLPELMVSQPGCGYAILLCSWTQQDSSGSGDEAPATPGSEGPSRDVVLHLTTGRIHNKNVSTHLIGSISKGSKEESSKCGLFALCTLDGTLKLMDSSEQLLWSVQVDHQLFALQKLDVTGDGREEVVACAWDGQTYIIDHNRTVVRFQFDENVNAFCAGQYTCKEGRNSPCLVYVSFNHKIYIYWKVELERMESTNLLRVLEEKPEFRSHLKELEVDAEDSTAVRALVADILYRDVQT